MIGFENGIGGTENIRSDNVSMCYADLSSIPTRKVQINYLFKIGIHVHFYAAVMQ